MMEMKQAHRVLYLGYYDGKLSCSLLANDGFFFEEGEGEYL